jgi:fatty acid synthase subunit beta
MRKQDYSIDGITIGAGVSLPDHASEIVAQMRKVGIRHLSFKPSSTATILEVLKIAELNPEITIIL